VPGSSSTPGLSIFELDLLAGVWNKTMRADGWVKRTSICESRWTGGLGNGKLADRRKVGIEGVKVVKGVDSSIVALEWTMGFAIVGLPWS
jgi:hypothetical protein